MKTIKRIFSSTWAWVIIFWAIAYIFGSFGSFSSGEKIERDTALDTQRFDTDIVVGEDQSYDVTEHIVVDFKDSRHGIFRYVPYKGNVISFDRDGKEHSVPYYASITDADANDVLETSTESGSWVGRLGDEDDDMFGEWEYEISYRFTPRFQTKSYNNAYYNVFPNQWQNPIPKGSSFTVIFPKSFDHSILKFYYGQQGESKDAAEILDISWDGDQVSGTLRRDLKFGEGVTFYAPMQAGYFSKTRNMDFLSTSLLIPGIVICLAIAVLYLLFGRDEKIIPSIQYQPPEGLDSASVGYIIDGQVDNEDVISLIVYWADKGYLRIEEKKKKNLLLIKLKDLPEDAPAYQTTVFSKLFEKSDQTNISRLKYKFQGTMDIAKDQIKDEFGDSSNKGVFTRSSKVSRIAAMIFCTFPLGWFMLQTSYYSMLGTVRFIAYIVFWILLFAGMFVICTGVDKWYAKSSMKRKRSVNVGILMCAIPMAVYAGDYISRAMNHEIFNYTWQLVFVFGMTAAGIWLTVFMKKRTSQSTEWMGRIAGLRDFIETAELDRMNELAGDNPEWFYHIIPYAYVFGLSDVFAEKLKDLSLPAPEWYVPRRNYTFFDYYTFNMLMTRSLSDVTTTLTVPKPSSSSGSSGGSGGGFSGSSGGGGFSGGGFGGGGGGSW